MTPEIKKFIAEHSQDDVQKLALQSARFPHIDMAFALRQITGMQKTKSKIPTFYENTDILYPIQLSLEQSSSESTAKYKSSLCEGETFADLTGGFGIDCYFISQKFSQSSYVERHTELCEIATNNFKALGANNIAVFNRQSEEFLTEMTPVDLIFIDPARRGAAGNKVVSLSDCEPNVAKLSSLLLEKAKKVLIKLSPMLDISLALKELPETKEVHIVSVDNECKEVLLLLDDNSDKNLTIKTINIIKDAKIQQFDYLFADESVTQASFAKDILKYIYEPNSSIMKSGAFNLISERFGIQKLHKNTHLYTANVLIENFPGRIFETEQVSGSSKQEIKELQKSVTKANIAVRNYPLSVEEFRKKTGIKDGGSIYIFACKTSNDANSIIKCRKINLESK